MEHIKKKLEEAGLWDNTVEQELSAFWKYGVSQISNEFIRKSVIEFLRNFAPLGFFVNPASISGKYHPTWQNEKCGILRNTTECYLFVDTILEQYKEFCDNTDKALPSARDIVLSATILSDTFKYGDAIVLPHSGAKKHVREHGKLAADKWLEAAYQKPPQGNDINLVEEIYDATYWHLGRWTPGWTPETKLSKLTEIVHILDAIFADKNLELLYEAKDVIG